MKNIVLIGFAATYKSSVAKQLAKLTGKAFYDTDAMVQQQTGKTISEIFSQNGEKFFRQCEHSVLIETSKLEGAIIATGGGAAMDEDGMAQLAKNSVIVWLLATPKTLQKRLSRSHTRPMFDGCTIHQIEQHLKLRTPYYQKWANHTLDCNNLTALDIAKKLQQLLGI